MIRAYKVFSFPRHVQRFNNIEIQKVSYLVWNTVQKPTIKDESQTCTPVYGQLKE
jgi:hypothetical protein